MTFPRPAFFLQNVLQLHHQRWVILRVDSLALWKMMRRMPSWSKKIEARILPADVCTRDFLGRGEPLCRYSVHCCLSPIHSDITRFCPWSQIATGNHLDSAEKNPKFAQTTGARLTFLIRVQTFRDPLRGELPHVQIFKNEGPIPLTWDAQLHSHRFSRDPAVFQH